MFDKAFEFIVVGLHLLLFICLLPLTVVLYLISIFTGKEFGLLDRILELLPF